MNYVLNENKMFADITDGIAIVINSETGVYYGFNELATSIFENFMKGVSSDKVISELKTLAQAPVDIEKRVETFIKELVSLEILIESSSKETLAQTPEIIALNSDFVMEIKEYTDAQELLLADPIHEVKEESGWTPEKDSIGYSKEETAQREEKVEAQV